MAVPTDARGPYSIGHRSGQIDGVDDDGALVVYVSEQVEPGDGVHGRGSDPTKT